MTPRTAPLSIETLLSERDFIRGLARKLVRSGDLGDDIAQDAFVAALAKPPAAPVPARRWFAGVVRRLAARHFRAGSARRRRETRAARSEGGPSVSEIVEREEIRRRVVRAVLGLKEPYRTVVVLRFYDGLPPRGISERLDVPVETVRTRTRRALVMLRERLDRESGGDRRAWAGALLPFAAASTAVGKGVLLMGSKTKIGIAVAMILAAGLATGIAVLRNEPDVAPESVAEEPGNLPHEVAASVDEDAPKLPALEGHYVRGIVVDEDGRPAAGARVAIVADENPFSGEAGTRINNWLGNVVRAGPDGVFLARFDGPREVRVGPDTFDPAFAGGDAAGEVWVRTPADDLRFVIVRKPTATFVIRCLDRSSGRRLEKFRPEVSGPGAVRRSLEETAPGVYEATVRLLDEGAAEVRISLSEPRTTEPVCKVFHPSPGDRIEVLLAFRSGKEIRGIVRDADGAPVGNALVFFGTQRRGRGDEPFQDFRADRIHDGVRTGPNGDFVLSGDGDTVTVWHDDLSPVTTPSEGAWEIVLPPRGRFAGRLLDARGLPVPEAEVRLNRTLSVRTDAGGRFSFEKLEAGVHGLFLPDRRLAGIRIEPGADLRADIDAGLPEVRVSLTSGGSPFTAAERIRDAFVIGLGTVFVGHEVELPKDAGEFTLRGALPGRHLLLLENGMTAVFTIDGPEATVDLGASALSIGGPEGSSVRVLPEEGADDLTTLLAEREVRLRIRGTRRLRLAPLPAGRYRVEWSKGENSRSALVDVSGPETWFDIPAE